MEYSRSKGWGEAPLAWGSSQREHRQAPSPSSFAVRFVRSIRLHSRSRSTANNNSSIDHHSLTLLPLRDTSSRTLINKTTQPLHTRTNTHLRHLMAAASSGSSRGVAAGTGGAAVQIARTGTPEELRRVLLTAPFARQQRDPRGQTPLHIVCRREGPIALELATVLVSLSIDVNARVRRDQQHCDISLLMYSPCVDRAGSRELDAIACGS